MEPDSIHFETYSAKFDIWNVLSCDKLYYSYHNMFTLVFSRAILYPSVLTHSIFKLPKFKIHLIVDRL